MSNDSAYHALNPRHPFGIWKVTTEGDCEGRSTKQLGVYLGHLADIALFLASNATYTLSFVKILPTSDRESGNPSMDEVQVRVWTDGFELTVGEVQEMIKKGKPYNKNLHACKGQDFMAVKLGKEPDPVAKAMSKLDDEDKKALGLL